MQQLGLDIFNTVHIMKPSTISCLMYIEFAKLFTKANVLLLRCSKSQAVALKLNKFVAYRNCSPSQHVILSEKGVL